MKKIILSKIKVQQIKAKNLTTFEMDFDDDFIYPIYKKPGLNMEGKTGRHIPSGVFTENNKTHAAIYQRKDEDSPGGARHVKPAKYTEGETYLIDQEAKVKIEKVELLQRENIFYWKYTISLVETPEAA